MTNIRTKLQDQQTEPCMSGIWSPENGDVPASVFYLPWEMNRALRSPWTLWWSSWACSWWPRPPVWWCSAGQTGPWSTPRTGSPSSASPSSRPSRSWWPRGFPFSQLASGDLCTPLQTHLRMESKHGREMKTFSLKQTRDYRIHPRGNWISVSFYSTLLKSEPVNKWSDNKGGW